MPTIGASAIVTSAEDVLLIKRRDCEAWALPGGNVDDGETVAETAIREVREETGIEIELTRGGAERERVQVEPGSGEPRV